MRRIPGIFAPGARGPLNPQQARLGAAAQPRRAESPPRNSRGEPARQPEQSPRAWRRIEPGEPVTRRWRQPATASQRATSAAPRTLCAARRCCWAASCPAAAGVAMRRCGGNKRRRECCANTEAFCSGTSRRFRRRRARIHHGVSGIALKTRRIQRTDTVCSCATCVSIGHLYPVRPSRLPAHRTPCAARRCLLGGIASVGGRRGDAPTSDSAPRGPTLNALVLLHQPELEGQASGQL